MTLSVANIILHQIKRDEQGELQVQLRPELLKLTPSSEHLVSEIHRVYSAKPAKGFANFAPQSEVKQLLVDLQQQQLNFVDFSSQSAAKLRDELIKYPFADEGILVLAEYQSLATDYLFIGLLSSCPSMKVTEQLDVSSTEYLDVAKMDIAARIDLSTWNSDPESNRYLTFIKGRVGRKVGDFFLDFLQADVGMDSKVQNQVLIQAVDDYCTDSRLDREEKQQYMKNVHQYCNEQLKSGEELIVKELADTLPVGDEGTDFYQFANQQGYELEESFPVDRAAVRKLTKYVGGGGGLSISFDAELLNERISYDPETDTLTIKGTPPNLKDQLQRRLTAED
ncbi:nucleoid-associated protein YejK [Vibrio sp. SS-MA-C1-2]|uniref:nucleoid-associated protein YejK n=1 Tax=Vibrio sp. SS-MA-C1-2 TaxID=2908646 RepID=UPI001F3C1C6B|nr:nucleoid-associated protein YejK [Vibrio sp. SS-MA-C1-2]UJF19863.1 nucleoid-associated protein YejK [Vibrio sp. SS-MA-C1-2]